MEAEVDKLELMFQKADSDLDYIQYRLEYEIKSNHHDSAGEKNPVTLIKELSAIKPRFQTLYARFKPVAIEQKEIKSHPKRLVAGRAGDVAQEDSVCQATILHFTV
ncbi:spindle and kinetochore-associated protein 2-like [Octodon degus]|uniref:Protein FAM33A n=1 Tax=Octodon degus TaxID=10160 RepID=A0A6P6E9I2_OCTDE|nr:spindle and kinetochore-associated protein 2-like [Octodon degus]